MITSELSTGVIEYLEKALSRTPSVDLTILEVIENINKNEGFSYAIRTEKGIVGATYFEIFEDTLNVVLLSVDNIRKFRGEIVQFYKQKMKELGLTNIIIISRHGWDRVIKDFEFVGAIYRYPGGGIRTKP